jgi:hypothetical protein
VSAHGPNVVPLRVAEIKIDSWMVHGLDSNGVRSVGETSPYHSLILLDQPTGAIKVRATLLRVDLIQTRCLDLSAFLRGQHFDHGDPVGWVPIV